MTEKNLVSDFIAFLNESCTAFHSVEAAKKRFLGAGFIEINESEEWRLIIGKSYFFIRNGTTIMAFTVGNGYVPGNGFTVIGAHTDSPCFKIKPNPTSKKSEALMLNTQPYGGGLWHTWFDRDLGLAGRVIIRAADGSLESRLFRIDTPISRIPTLAIHLTSGSEREHFAPNLQENAKALLTIDPAILSMKADTEGSGRFHPYLVQIIADNLGVNKASVVDMEIQLIDTQPSLIGGGASDFVFSGRLDNLCSSYQSLAALISSTGTLAAQKNICIAMLFDHEEVGSNSLNGAGSSLFMDTLRSLNLALADGSHATLMRALRKSLVVSADMAHGLHPNYPGKHDSDHAPKMNGGLVVKHNSNQRYATSAVSATFLRELAELAGETVQEFAVRSDSSCGSTIGPIIATLSGIMTVDVGSPQFSMHSIREMMGVRDVVAGYKIFRSVYENFQTVSEKNKIF